MGEKRRLSSYKQKQSLGSETEYFPRSDRCTSVLKVEILDLRWIIVDSLWLPRLMMSWKPDRSRNTGCLTTITFCLDNSLARFTVKLSFRSALRVTAETESTNFIHFKPNLLAITHLRAEFTKKV